MARVVGATVVGAVALLVGCSLITSADGLADHDGAAETDATAESATDSAAAFDSDVVKPDGGGNYDADTDAVSDADAVADAVADAAADVVDGSTTDAKCATGPDAAFTYAPSEVTVGVAATFTPAANGLNYAWLFASGTPNASSVKAPSVTWTTQGTYAAKLSVTDPATSCSATSTQSIAACTVTSSVQPFVGNTGGHPNAGIVFTSSVAATLRSFTFANQLNADTVDLVDHVSGTILNSQVVATNTVHFDVSWPLLANKTYRLVSRASDNGKFAIYPSNPFPVINGPITVHYSWLDGASYTFGPWFGFTDLRTCSP